MSKIVKLNTDILDRLQSYLCDIEIQENDIAKKYETKTDDCFERIFDTIASFGMYIDDLRDEIGR